VAAQLARASEGQSSAGFSTVPTATNAVEVARALSFIGTIGKLKCLKRAGWIRYGGTDVTFLSCN
jgi:hypothetical protein